MYYNGILNLFSGDNKLHREMKRLMIVFINTWKAVRPFLSSYGKTLLFLDIVSLHLIKSSCDLIGCSGTNILDI